MILRKSWQGLLVLTVMLSAVMMPTAKQAQASNSMLNIAANTVREQAIGSTLPNGLLAYLKLDEVSGSPVYLDSAPGTPFNDFYPSDVTPVNDVGPFGGLAMLTNPGTGPYGTNSFLGRDSTSDLQQGANTRTYSFFFKFNSKPTAALTDYVVFFNKGAYVEPPGHPGELRFYTETEVYYNRRNDRMGFEIADGTTQGKTPPNKLASWVECPTSPTVGVWHNLQMNAGIYSTGNGAVKIRMDGGPWSLSEFRPTPSPTKAYGPINVRTTDGPAFIAAHTDNGWFFYFTPDAEMARFTIWNRFLTEGESAAVRGGADVLN